ncbi:MAG: type II CAAX endopeptidase family protein [bacterium]
MTRRNFLLGLLTFAWLLLFAAKYVHVFRTEHFQGGGRFSFYLAETFLRLSLAREVAGSPAAWIYQGIALDSFKDLGKTYPGNGRILLETGIILYEMGRKEEALRSFNLGGRDVRCAALAGVLKDIYRENYSCSLNAVKTRKTLEGGFSGWFLNRALLHLYEKAGNRTLVGEIREEGESGGSRLFFRLSLIAAVLFLLELSGIVFWIVFFLRLRKTRGGESLPQPPCGFADTWLVFVSWEILQILAGKYLLKAFPDLSSIPLLVVVFTLNYAVALLFIFALFRQKFPGFLASLGLQGLRLKAAALAGFGGFLGALPLVTIAAVLSRLLFKGVNFSSNPVIPLIAGRMNFWDQALLFLLVACLAPLFEEILFRGLIYGVLRKTLKPWPAILLVSFLFSFLHVDPAGLLPIFVLGVLLAWLYERTGSLLSSVVLHALWNGLVFFLAGTFFRN